MFGAISNPLQEYFSGTFQSIKIRNFWVNYQSLKRRKKSNLQRKQNIKEKMKRRI